MKEYFIQFKPFLVFLAKFALSYLVLATVYQMYLNQFDVSKFEVDGFTQLVAEESRNILTFFDSNSYTRPNLLEPSVKLFYRGQWVARIIEGCNALSVIILFISFVIAFSGKIKHTLIYILVGSVIIHLFNVMRIALLCLAIYNYPSLQHSLHEVVFPLVIYGLVFLLWVIWVNKYSYYASTSSKK